MHAGHHVDGPQGVFIPPPPGSRPGIIVPAPIGTPPRVVVGAPPVINVGMRVNGNVENNSHNVTNNVTNITNVRNVTIVAPPTATANGRGYQRAVADAHRPQPVAPGTRPTAPVPQSTTPVAAWQPGHVAAKSLEVKPGVNLELPDAGERLEMVLTPPNLRQTYAYGGYDPAAPFEAVQNIPGVLPDDEPL